MVEEAVAVQMEEEEEEEEEDGEDGDEEEEEEEVRDAAGQGEQKENGSGGNRREKSITGCIFCDSRIQDIITMEGFHWKYQVLKMVLGLTASREAI